MKNISAFDFDGTITTCDTLIQFIRYACGNVSLITGILLYSPLLLLMKLHRYPNYKAKQKVFSHFFRGMTLERFDTLCRDFAANNRHLFRLKAMKEIEKAQSRGDTVIVVSASIENWVRPFFAQAEEQNDSPVYIIGTQIECIDGIVTGRFKTPNCYGQEKVRRILEVFPERDQYHITAYGDSRGDREMLAFADKVFFKPFR